MKSNAISEIPSILSKSHGLVHFVVYPKILVTVLQKMKHVFAASHVMILVK